MQELIEPAMHDLHNDSARTDCLFVEVFSGSCRLSKACHSLDFRCTAIDKDPGRSENFPVYVCDITNEEQFLNLRTYLEKREVPSCMHTLLQAVVLLRVQENGQFQVSKPLQSL